LDFRHFLEKHPKNLLGLAFKVFWAYNPTTLLYTQHTEETGQVFTPEALDLAYELTMGQPWLVNALARQCVEFVVPDPTMAIEASHINPLSSFIER
jgi:hypothetical protein